MPRRVGKLRLQVRAFTLIELMVTVSIIALLVGILLPAMNGVRRQAKITDTAATISALGQGNEMFKGNQNVGGQYVPSATDSINDGSTGFGWIANPQQPMITPAATNVSQIGGAHLLALGMAGADTLGTAGFRDLDGDQFWYDDQGNNGADAPPTAAKGSYYLYQTGSQAGAPARPRYGPFVGDNALKRMSTLRDLNDAGALRIPGPPTSKAVMTQRFFVDSWDRPILYYRARRGAIHMLTMPTGEPGIYDVRDNAYFTGVNFTGLGSFVGYDFGAGADHKISDSGYPLPNQNLNAFQNEYYFERFVGDLSVSQRPTPVNKDTFLLISAGPDALYGTSDDVVNWRKD